MTPDESSAAPSNTAPPEPSGGRSRQADRQLRGSSLLLAGRFISMGANFLAQVLIVRHLAQGEYGAFALALSFVSLGSTIVTLGLDRGVGRFLAIYDEQRDYDRLLGTLLMVAGTILTLGLALVLLVVGLQGALLGLLIGDDQAIALLVILIALAPIESADNLLGGTLAVFASARAIFFRKYVVGPALRLVVVLLLVAGDQDAGFLAAGYVVSGALGVAVYAGILLKVLDDRGLRSQLRLATVKIPAREILAFTLPLLSTDLVFIAMNTTDAIILGHFWGTEEVASFRVVQPLAGLNAIVFSSFTLLYMPAASRLFARQDRAGVAHLYWRTAIWMAVLSFPIFALTTSLASSVTVALYGERYAGSAVYLTLLSIGYYTNAALGFNGLTLRVLGLVRYTVGINLLAAAFNLILNFTLIPPFGAMGAAVATMSTMLLHNVLKQAGLRRGTGIDVFAWEYFRVYALIILAAIALGLIQLAFRPPIWVDLGLAAIASLVVLLGNRQQLRVGDTFPELLRLPLMRRLLGV